MPPASSTTLPAISAISPSEQTSQRTARARPPASSSSAAAAAFFSSLRAAMATVAPAAARPRANPRPMPLLPPVTMATLPLRSNMLM